MKLKPLEVGEKVPENEQPDPEGNPIGGAPSVEENAPVAREIIDPPVGMPLPQSVEPPLSPFVGIAITNTPSGSRACYFNWASGTSL